VKVRQIDSAKNNHILRNLRRKEKKLDVSNSSLLRMLNVYRNSTQAELAKGKHPAGMERPSASDSVK